MSEFLRRLGKAMGKLANREGLVSGLISAIDPKVVANAVNENKEFMKEVMRYLDPDALAGVINDNPDFMAKLIKNLDASAVASAMNKNQRFITQLIENINPNVFSRAVNVLFNKIRKATYRPGLTPVEEMEESA